MSEAFDPSHHTVALRQGTTYLLVGGRVAWLHDLTKTGLEAAAGYSIDTEPHTITSDVAIFRAEVRVMAADGSIIRRAVGWGTQTPTQFGEYVEKAETKAIGRALARAGFGTDTLDEDVVADSPRQDGGRPAPAANGNGRPPANGNGNGAGRQQAAPRSGGTGRATDRQLRFYESSCQERGVDPREFSFGETGTEEYAALSTRDMSQLIDAVRTPAPAHG